MYNNVQGAAHGFLKRCAFSKPVSLEVSFLEDVMPRNIELDLEVLDAGVNYTLYASALVALAQALNRGIDTNPPQQAVDRYAQRLNGALVRCGIDITIPRELRGADDILRFFQSNRLMLDISNLLVRQHSHRQELIFILSCVVGGVIAGSTGGVSDSTGVGDVH